MLNRHLLTIAFWLAVVMASFWGIFTINENSRWHGLLGLAAGYALVQVLRYCDGWREERDLRRYYQTLWDNYNEDGTPRDQ